MEKEPRFSRLPFEQPSIPLFTNSLRSNRIQHENHSSREMKSFTELLLYVWKFPLCALKFHRFHHLCVTLSSVPIPPFTSHFPQPSLLMESNLRQLRLGLNNVIDYPVFEKKKKKHLNFLPLLVLSIFSSICNNRFSEFDYSSPSKKTRLIIKCNCYDHLKGWRKHYSIPIKCHTYRRPTSISWHTHIAGMYKIYKSCNTAACLCVMIIHHPPNVSGHIP